MEVLPSSPPSRICRGRFLCIRLSENLPPQMQFRTLSPDTARSVFSLQSPVFEPLRRWIVRLVAKFCELMSSLWTGWQVKPDGQIAYPAVGHSPLVGRRSSN